jgi:glutamate-1-semialdehyde 2,1-aminomutase
MPKGVPSEFSELSSSFKFNDIESLQSLIEQFPNEISCVVLEPLATACPKTKDEEVCCSENTCSRSATSEWNFLHAVQDLCRKNGIVFILDEMITGFRWGLGGAQGAFNLRPDLSTFGKAMANGFPLACVTGRREIMSLGAIDTVGQERVFFLSTTHGSDMASLGAFIANVEFIKKYPVKDKVWDLGFKLINLMNSKAQQHGISEYFRTFGPACSPRYETRDSRGNNSLEFRTLFMQELLRKNIMMPWISMAFRHYESHLDQVCDAIESAFSTYASALESGPSQFVEGEFVKPVFRRFN